MNGPASGLESMFLIGSVVLGLLAAPKINSLAEKVL